MHCSNALLSITCMFTGLMTVDQCRSMQAKRKGQRPIPVTPTRSSSTTSNLPQPTPQQPQMSQADMPQIPPRYDMDVELRDAGLDEGQVVLVKKLINDRWAVGMPSPHKIQLLPVSFVLLCVFGHLNIEYTSCSSKQ